MTYPTRTALAWSDRQSIDQNSVSELVGSELAGLPKGMGTEKARRADLQSENPCCPEPPRSEPVTARETAQGQAPLGRVAEEAPLEHSWARRPSKAGRG